MPRRELRRALRRAHASVLAREDRLAADLTGVFEQAGKVAARNFKKRAAVLVAAGGPPANWTPPHPDEILDLDLLMAKVRTKTDPVRRAAIADYGRELRGVAKEAGLSADWFIENPLAGRVLAGTAQHVVAISDTARLNVMRIVRLGHEQGLTVTDTARLIRDGMAAAGPVRARLIARTELAQVANGSSLAATRIVADATGTSYWKRWLCAPGAVHPRHEDYEGLDQQTVALDETFEVGDAQLAFPGDPDGPPEEVCLEQLPLRDSCSHVPGRAGAR